MTRTKKILISIPALFFAISTYSQSENPTYGISLSGYIKHDVFGDTRTTISGREGHFLLAPVGPEKDIHGKDIHEYNRLHMLAIQSRLSVKFTGSDVLGAKASGVFETDFFGQANPNINLLRMRHAFYKLNWTKTEVLAGQFWNPLFVTSCFPGTLSFNTGTPFNSFNRAPQIRVTHKEKDVTFTIAALSQRDYPTYGPIGPSHTYLSNAVYPNVYGLVQYDLQDTAGKFNLQFGFGGESKHIVPRIVNEKGEKVDETLHSMSCIVYAKLTTKALTWKINYRYGENNTDIMALSGFAVKDTTNGSKFLYTPLTNRTIWTDIHTNNKEWNIGLFSGLYFNTGAKEEMKQANNPVYGLAQNVATLFRISPRISYTSGKFIIGAEVEYTGAYYGANFDSFYIPASTKYVANNRILFTTIYNF